MPEIQTFSPSDLEIALRHCHVSHYLVMEALIYLHGWPPSSYMPLTLPCYTMLISSPKENNDDIYIYICIKPNDFGFL